MGNLLEKRILLAQSREQIHNFKELLAIRVRNRYRIRLVLCTLKIKELESSSYP